MNKKVTDKTMQITYSLGMIILIVLAICSFIYLLVKIFIQN